MGARAEVTLHDDAVDPAPMLPSDRCERPSRAESGPPVQCDRGFVGAVADDRHHLPISERLAFHENSAQKRRTNALPARIGVDVDRILDCKAVGWPAAIGSGISKAEDRRAR